MVVVSSRWARLLAAAGLLAAAVALGVWTAHEAVPDWWAVALLALPVKLSRKRMVDLMGEPVRGF